MTRLLTAYRDLCNAFEDNRPLRRSRARVDLRAVMRQNLDGSYEPTRRAPSMYRHYDIASSLLHVFGDDRVRMFETTRAYKAGQIAFGKLLAEAIRDDDSEGAVELINNNASLRDRARTVWCDLLDEKFGGSYYQCNDCNHIDEEGNGSYAYDGTWVCDSCIDDNYTWSDRRDTYVSNDDYDDEDEEEEDEDNGVIGNYHHSKRHVCHIPSAYDKIDNPAVLLGLELEMECHVDHNRYEKAQELSDKIHRIDVNGTSYPYAFFEEDGSINYGFEMVTSYTGLDVHAEQLKVFRDKPVRGLRSHDTSSCGLHVHVSRAGMTTFHACKLAFFIHDSGNQRLLRALARRSNSRHAKMVNKKADSQWIRNAKSDGIQRLNDDRYEAVNFQNGNTVEFRLFKGTLRYESIMACLEFAYITWFFSRDMGVTELTEAKFLEYICQPNKLKHTKFLREYLRSKNFSLPMKDKQPKQDVVEV